MVLVLNCLLNTDIDHDSTVKKCIAMTLMDTVKWYVQ